MTVPIAVVDAFTDRAFSGNPAAVVLLEGRWPSDDWLQAVAAEVNLAETAFCVRRDDGDRALRWFTPTTEVDLCGHATLATTFVLDEPGPVRFHTRSGVLTCHRHGAEVEMDFPADDPHPVAVPGSLGAVLGTADLYEVARGRSDLVVELGSAAAVRQLTPDLARIAALPFRAVIVTAPGDRDGVDCVSRVFAPAVGVPEDAVTGSAHCTLAGFWGSRLGRDTLVGEQASARGGTVRMRRAGDRVVLGGTATVVWRGELLADPA